uniref:Cilia and flagella associated protein 20 n=1 Tax=Sarcophilus harrisii TaxID=9305 RepID=A0A7N4P2R0_SARHA
MSVVIAIRAFKVRSEKLWEFIAGEVGVPSVIHRSWPDEFMNSPHVLPSPCDALQTAWSWPLGRTGHQGPVWPVSGLRLWVQGFPPWVWLRCLKKPFWWQVLDDKNVRRRFRASNYQSTTRVKPFICTMPMRLDDGWNQIQFNLSDFTRRAYGTNYIETLRVQIHANCRIRRVYFSDRLYSEDELPAEFKLYLPVQNKAKQ